MAVAVDIVVMDTELIPQPIAGVAINVYDTSGNLQGNSTTDSTGTAFFSLPGAASPGGVTYEVRAFKLGVIFPAANPTQILVFDPLPSMTFNNFTLTGTLLTLEPSIDPTLCRCTGRLMDFGNQPVPHALVRVAANTSMERRGRWTEHEGQGLQSPKIVNSNLISPDAKNYYTDENGFVKIDLFQTGQYWVTFSGESDASWNILVPARSSANLIDLLFPQPVSLTWDGTVAPGNAVTVEVGHMVAVPFYALFSDWEINPTDMGKWITFQESGTAGVAGLGFRICPGLNDVYITGLMPGTVNVNASLLPNLMPYRVPAYSLSAPSLAITVVA